LSKAHVNSFAITSKELVFETRAIKCLIKMIEEEDIVTVIGSPGCGKTTAIHHVALRLNKECLPLFTFFFRWNFRTNPTVW
jgi:MoxR-like ATPase